LKVKDCGEDFVSNVLGLASTCKSESPKMLTRLEIEASVLDRNATRVEPGHPEIRKACHFPPAQLQALCE
jgi:hypothetical protein